MDANLEPIQFHTEGFAEYGDLSPFLAVAEALRDTAIALNAITSSISSRRRAAVAWVVSVPEAGSFVVPIHPVPYGPLGASVATETVKLYVATGNALRHDRQPPKRVPKKAVAAVQRTIERVESGDLGDTIVSRGDAKLEITYSHAVDTGIQKYHALATLEGRLTGVQFLAPALFTLREPIHGVTVRCYFDSNVQSEQVIASLRQRVAVSGMVSWDLAGIPRSITAVDSIIPLRSRHELPQTDDIIGIDPDLTEGLTSVEWVRRQRA